MDANNLGVGVTLLQRSKFEEEHVVMLASKAFSDTQNR